MAQRPQGSLVLEAGSESGGARVVRFKPWRCLLPGVGVLLVLTSCGAGSEATDSTVAAEVHTAPISHYSFTVDSEDDLWLHTAVRASAGDMLIIRAAGEIVVSDSPHTEAGPKGWRPTSHDCIADKSSGALIARFGDGEPFCTGDNSIFSVTDDQLAHLRLKVLDGNYTNNYGQFDVEVLVLPAGLVKAPETVERVLERDEAEAGVIQGAHREESTTEPGTDAGS